MYPYTHSSDGPIRITAICGSPRPGSRTRSALQVVLDAAEDAGAIVTMVELGNLDLPLAGSVSEDFYPMDVARLRQTVSLADGIVLGTPEYHGSLSGMLKNAIDLLGQQQFDGKAVGLVGVAGGAQGAGSSLNHLRDIGRSLHAWVLPQQVSVAHSGRVISPDGSIMDADLLTRLHELGARLTHATHLCRQLATPATPAAQPARAIA